MYPYIPTAPVEFIGVADVVFCQRRKDGRRTGHSVGVRMFTVTDAAGPDVELGAEDSVIVVVM